MDLPPPASGEIADGWLHGRGSADSKAGAAIFTHVAARLRDTADGFGGAKPTSSTRDRWTE
jgi:succinyl-diaminopimelate desuccinylase